MKTIDIWLTKKERDVASSLQGLQRTMYLQEIVTDKTRDFKYKDKYRVIKFDVFPLIRVLSNEMSTLGV